MTEPPADQRVTRTVVENLHAIQSAEWDSLTSSSQPFTRHAYLSALEQCGCVGEKTGWLPQHWLWRDEQQRLIAALPLYEKWHSYGEYTFDWAWADAYSRNGLDYYPKLLSAIPFTPVAGERFLFSATATQSQRRQVLLDALEGLSKPYESAHILFMSPVQRDLLGQIGEEQEQDAFSANGWLSRKTLTFEWLNQGYRSFDDFLAQLNSKNRKKIKRERRKIKEQQIRVERYSGADITDELWQFFIRCYQTTYLKRSGHSGYLNRAFFEQIKDAIVDNLHLVVAKKEQHPIGAALFVSDQQRLYGRYWGTPLENLSQPVDGLHFECCYYQGMELAIELNCQAFEPGIQGEHKVLRGCQATLVDSLHHVSDPMFAEAIKRFIEQETRELQTYREQLNEHLPFKRTD